MKRILIPAVGLNYYDSTEIVSRGCEHITRDAVMAIISFSGLCDTKRLSTRKYLPEHFSLVVDILKRQCSRTTCYVIDRTVEDLFELEPSMYVDVFKSLKSVWIPNEWKNK